MDAKSNPECFRPHTWSVEENNRALGRYLAWLKQKKPLSVRSEAPPPARPGPQNQTYQSAAL